MPKKLKQWRVRTLAVGCGVIVLSAFFCSLLTGCREAPDFEKYAFDAKEAAKRREQAAEFLGVDKELARISHRVYSESTANLWYSMCTKNLEATKGRPTHDTV